MYELRYFANRDTDGDIILQANPLSHTHAAEKARESSVFSMRCVIAWINCLHETYCHNIKFFVKPSAFEVFIDLLVKKKFIQNNRNQHGIIRKIASKGSERAGQYSLATKHLQHSLNRFMSIHFAAKKSSPFFHNSLTRRRCVCRRHPNMDRKPT